MIASAAWTALGTGAIDDAVSELSVALLDLGPDDERRTLPLHVLSIIEMERGASLTQLNALMSEAMRVERLAGCESIALHSSHQLALLTRKGATIARVGAYYKETYETLTRMRNSAAAALCLKSMAEIYLGKGRLDGAMSLLEKAEPALRNEGRAAAHVAAWIRMLR